MITTIFLVLIFFYSLLSRRLERTVITAPMVFTWAGLLTFLLPPWLSEVNLERKGLLLIAEIGLVLTLFTDATHINLQSLRGNRNLPLRLLSTGMLLTIVLGTVSALVVIGRISLWEAAILAAILAPTDAGLGQVIVSSPLVPRTIREALSVEAGLNDGLSVPFLMVFIAFAAKRAERPGVLLTQVSWEQLGYGALIGIAIGLSGGWLLGAALRKRWVTQGFQQLGLITLPLLSMIWAEAIAGSMFIAAYVAGLFVQIRYTEAGHQAAEFSEHWGRLFNFFVFFLFGLFVARDGANFDAAVLLYAILSLTLVRMLPVALALLGTGLSRSTVLFMGWFGPRGLVSIVLGLVYLEQHANLPGEQKIRLAVMATVLLSIFAHGLSALPGIGFYAKKIASLDSRAPEYQQNGRRPPVDTGGQDGFERIS